MSCKQEQKIDFNTVSSNFKEYSNKIKKVEYNIQRIDTFSRGSMVWNNKGYALIEKKNEDEIYGFSFYGKRNDIDEEYLYDNDNGFEILRNEKKYAIEHPRGIIGSPGGQMILQHIFYLDSVYKNVELIENDDKYILRYQFENDTVFNVTDILKTIELTKDNYFPTKVTISSKTLGNKGFTQYILSDIKINSDVKKSIKSIKESIIDFEVIQPEIDEPNAILNKKFPEINLPNLLDENQIVNLEINKLTLIDFWEVWCGWCIKSFPEVEKLKNKYPEKLQVIGILTQDKESAIKLIEKKKTTFTNLIGNKKLLENYSVNSYPRYFLIDKKGIVRKEYFGFSENIEKDIKLLLSE